MDLKAVGVGEPQFLRVDDGVVLVKGVVEAGQPLPAAAGGAVQFLGAHVVHRHEHRLAVPDVEEVHRAGLFHQGRDLPLLVHGDEPGFVLLAGDEIEGLPLPHEAAAAAVPGVGAHRVADGKEAVVKPLYLPAVGSGGPKAGHLGAVIYLPHRPGKDHPVPHPAHLPDTVAPGGHGAAGAAGGVVVDPDAGGELVDGGEVVAVVDDLPLPGADRHTLHVEVLAGDPGQGAVGGVVEPQPLAPLAGETHPVEPEGVLVKDGEPGLLVPDGGQFLLPGRAGEVMQPLRLAQVPPGPEDEDILVQLADGGGVQRHGEPQPGAAPRQGEGVEGGALLPLLPGGVGLPVPWGREGDGAVPVPDEGGDIPRPGQLPQPLPLLPEPEVGIVAVFLLVGPVGQEGGLAAAGCPGGGGDGCQLQKVIPFDCLHPLSLLIPSDVHPSRR